MNVVSNAVPVLLQVAGAVAALVLIMQRTSGRARTVGIVGAVLVIASPVISVIYSIVMAPILQQIGPERVLPLIVVQSLLRVLLFGVGVILLALSVVLAHRQPTPAPPTPYPPSGHPYSPPGPPS